MAIQFTPLPPAPNRNDPENFANTADQFVNALPLFQVEANAIGLEAETNALNSAQSAFEALQSETNAAISFDDLQKRYLGALAEDPLVDLNGDPLESGALYFNTTLAQLRIFDGLSFVPIDPTGSAAAAAASAQQAQESATQALQSETNAALSASDAATSAANALQSENDAQTLFNNFSARYLGSLANDPARDLQDNPLIDGALYFNTTSNILKVYDLGNTTWLSLGDALGIIGGGGGGTGGFGFQTGMSTYSPEGAPTPAGFLRHERGVPLLVTQAQYPALYDILPINPAQENAPQTFNQVQYNPDTPNGGFSSELADLFVSNDALFLYRYVFSTDTLTIYYKDQLSQDLYNQVGQFNFSATPSQLEYDPNGASFVQRTLTAPNQFFTYFFDGTVFQPVGVAEIFNSVGFNNALVDPNTSLSNFALDNNGSNMYFWFKNGNTDTVEFYTFIYNINTNEFDVVIDNDSGVLFSVSTQNGVENVVFSRFTTANLQKTLYLYGDGAVGTPEVAPPKVLVIDAATATVFATSALPNLAVGSAEGYRGISASDDLTRLVLNTKIVNQSPPPGSENLFDPQPTVRIFDDQSGAASNYLSFQTLLRPNVIDGTDATGALNSGGINQDATRLIFNGLKDDRSDGVLVYDKNVSNGLYELNPFYGEFYQNFVDFDKSAPVVSAFRVYYRPLVDKVIVYFTVIGAQGRTEVVIFDEPQAVAVEAIEVERIYPDPEIPLGMVAFIKT